jgi:type I restriction enzyme, S subunit
MREWQQKTIGDLVTLQRGIDLPDAERRPGSVPIMGSFGITGRHNEAACKGPGVTVGRSGASAGVVSYIEQDYWPLNTCLYVRDFKGNHPRFAYYLLKTFDLASLNSGSAQPSLNRNFVHPVSATFPDPPEQAAIASILGALDDKIELNRRMNETLEAMARAIFKDWFVDFGPTRAKQEGRAPYLAPDIWSLFPDRLDDEGKPEGWKSGTLGDIASQVGESVSPERLAPVTPYIGLEHMPRRSIALENWEGAGKVTSGKLAFNRGDFLFGKLRPYFHKVGIAPLDGICSTDIVVLNAKMSKARSFVIACISQDEFVAFTDRTSDGTKMPSPHYAAL